jgi:MoaF N-terminal domain
MLLIRLVAAIILLPLSAYAAAFGDTNVDRLLEPPEVAQQQPQPPPQIQAPEPQQKQQAQAETFPLIGHPFEVQYNDDPKLTYDIAYLDDESVELKPADGKMQPLRGQYTAHEIAQHLYMVFFYFPQIAQSVTHIYDLDHGHVWANITRINTGKSDEEFQRDPLDLWGMQGEMRLLEKK